LNRQKAGPEKRQMIEREIFTCRQTTGKKEEETI
jgi:hypothetical protein